MRPSRSSTVESLSSASVPSMPSVPFVPSSAPISLSGSSMRCLMYRSSARSSPASSRAFGALHNRVKRWLQVTRSPSSEMTAMPSAVASSVAPSSDRALASSRCVRTRALTMAGLIGLAMKSTAPSDSPRASSSTPSRAVTKITGMPAVAGLAFRWPRTS